MIIEFRNAEKRSDKPILSVFAMCIVKFRFGVETVNLNTISTNYNCYNGYKT